jgi:hypothetical protein
VSDVQGKRVEGYDEAKGTPGAFWWSGDPPKRLTFFCPCGCGSAGGVAVGVDLLDRDGNHPVWQWDGDLDRPTIMPSIQFLSGCKWHGFLTDGVFKSV